MTDPQLYEKAADCFRRAGLTLDAARCYRLAGAYRRAGEQYAAIGEYREAALDYERSNQADLAAWLLAHRAGDPAAARALIARNTSREAGLTLHQRLALARCAIVDGAPAETIPPVIGDVCAELSDQDALYDRFLEEWAVALAEHLRRYDQVALVYAASVRGRRHGAETRWAQWALRVLGTELIIPTGTDPVRQPA
ncbi:hypothetical protein AB0G15_14820 [Streptosporangium sp. NPDC023825]|uniref:hypothetical protein n=1 Tax=Streptosporangium sp. NPDC023825 TaxID=3154909 RepID=UPI003434F436